MRPAWDRRRGRWGCAWRSVIWRKGGGVATSVRCVYEDWRVGSEDLHRLGRSFMHTIYGSGEIYPILRGYGKKDMGNEVNVWYWWSLICFGSRDVCGSWGRSECWKAAHRSKRGISCFVSKCWMKQIKALGCSRSFATWIVWGPKSLGR